MISIEEIKIKSNEASSDIKRSMREIRDSTKEGVEVRNFPKS